MFIGKPRVESVFFTSIKIENECQILKIRKCSPLSSVLSSNVLRCLERFSFGKGKTRVGTTAPPGSNRAENRAFSGNDRSYGLKCETFQTEKALVRCGCAPLLFMLRERSPGKPDCAGCRIISKKAAGKEEKEVVLESLSL